MGITNGVGAVVAAMGAALAFAAGIQSILTLPLLLRIITIGLACVTLLEIITSRLARWASPPPSMPGYGRELSRPDRRRLVAGIVVIGTIIIVFVLVVLMQTQRVPLRFIENMKSGNLLLHVFAGRPANADITISKPLNTECDWKPVRGKVSAQTVGWESRTAILRIAAFADPQAIEVRCAPIHNVTTAITTNPEIETHLLAYVNMLRVSVLVIGGITWVIFALRLLRLSRS